MAATAILTGLAVPAGFGPARRPPDRDYAGRLRLAYRGAAGGVLPAPGPARSDGLAPSERKPDAERIRLDHALMVRVAAGDDGAFASIVGDETPRLVRFARSLLAASPAEAEEVVQEALLRLWRQADAWQPNGRVSTWLHQVTYRLCIDALRRQRASVPIDSVEADLPDTGPAPDDGLLRTDDVGAVRAALERLPERQRSAIVLCHFQELSQAEASSVMGIGESAYESLLARARRRLRVLLSDGATGEKGGGP
jgi:RNA polymerase sigma-70 factor (ECF subfamily)